MATLGFQVGGIYTDVEEPFSHKEKNVLFVVLKMSSMSSC